MPKNTRHIVFESEWDTMPLVLDYKESVRQNKSILDNYGILSDSNLYSHKNMVSQ